MEKMNERNRSLAAEITWASSKQTYYTIRFLADQEYVEDAYRAYGYFRWVDDILDTPEGSREEKLHFVNRQRALLETSYLGSALPALTPEEQLLVELIQNDSGDHPGLHSYLDNMMAVMEFDVERRDRAITQAELDEYSRRLAFAVMDALLYFIGHNDPPPEHPGRYHAVTAAHITHLLRDTYEDLETGYYNIPRSFLHAHGMPSQSNPHPAYREWVFRRVEKARAYFQSGRAYITQVKNFRCRLAGFAYAARFEWVLSAIERDNYDLREDYSQRKGFWAALRMAWSTIISMFAAPFMTIKLAVQPFRIEEK